MPACLVIDDNDVSLTVAQRMVEKLGFEVTSAHSAAEAMPYLAKAEADVVLLDWHMPGMNGIELLKLIRQTAEGRKLAVFIYSGVEDERGIQEALCAGADGFIPKPITPEKISSEFRKIRLI
jgi:CheY-like chemotaxis protein